MLQCAVDKTTTLIIILHPDIFLSDIIPDAYKLSRGQILTYLKKD